MQHDAIVHSWALQSHLQNLLKMLNVSVSHRRAQSFVEVLPSTHVNGKRHVRRVYSKQCGGHRKNEGGDVPPNPPVYSSW